MEKDATSRPVRGEPSVVTHSDIMNGTFQRAIVLAQNVMLLRDRLLGPSPRPDFEHSDTGQMGAFEQLAVTAAAVDRMLSEARDDVEAIQRSI